jgi:hypothetical protein
MQDHQQLQEQLQQLKQQHELQISTLSAVQQAQLQVQAGVQQLQQLYLKLGQAPAAKQTQHNNVPASTDGSQQQQQQRNATQQPIGVICTVLRNEARYVPEWVAFHLLMGATKIVIYDDNSTDSLGKAVAAFGDSVVIMDLYKDVTGVPGDGGVHRVHGRQGKYYYQVCSLFGLYVTMHMTCSSFNAALTALAPQRKQGHTWKCIICCANTALIVTLQVQCPTYT